MKNSVVPPDAFKKRSSKIVYFELIENIISTSFFTEKLLQQSLKISLLLFADLLKAAFPIHIMMLCYLGDALKFAVTRNCPFDLSIFGHF